MAPPTRHAIAHMLHSQNPNRLLILAGDSMIYDLEKTVKLLRLAEPRGLRGVFLRIDDGGLSSMVSYNQSTASDMPLDDPWFKVPTVRDFPRSLLEVFRRASGLGRPLPFKRNPRKPTATDPFKPLRVGGGG